MATSTARKQNSKSAVRGPKQARPFIKWLGGKTGVLPQVLNRIPDEIRTYYEPFVGGGSLLFHLANAKRFHSAVISDTNEDLINAYKVIQSNVDGLIKELGRDKYVYEETAFYEIRNENVDSLSQVEKAARFIYLNKTCFNGLYRVNKSGLFNAPFGRFTNPTILDAPNLVAVNAALQSVKILQGSYIFTSADAKRGDCVYFDPPYIPLSKTSNFTSYTSNGFDLEEHIKLRNHFRNMASRGVRVVLSNSYTPESIELYKGFDVDYISGSRNISGSAINRKPVKEIIVFAGNKV